MIMHNYERLITAFQVCNPLRQHFIDNGLCMVRLINEPAPTLFLFLSNAQTCGMWEGITGKDAFEQHLAEKYSCNTPGL